MSKLRIDTFVDQANEQMSGYVVLLDYHYKNLPIKAEPVSLLPIEIQIDDEVVKMEEVASASQPEWNQLMLIPNHEEYIEDICRCIPLFHPEFKIETTRYVLEETGQDQRVILLTMPEVDDERYDLLTNGVKSLATQCRGYVEGKYQTYRATAPNKLEGLTPEEINEGKQRLSELHEQLEKSIDQLLQDKLDEIEKAHNEYLQKQEAKKQHSQELSEDERVTTQYTFPDKDVTA